jgi:WD40 repeat protein
VNGICSVVLEYRILVASASSDGTVRLWDPDTAAPATLDDPYTALLIMSLGFRAVCAINAGGRLLLAAASDNYDVHLWDLPAAAPATTLRNGREATYLMMTIGPRLPSGIGVIHVDGRTILASSASRSSRDPEAHVQGHDVIRLNPGESSRVRLWDADSGDLQAILNGHDGDVLGICAIPPEDRAVLATASMDTTVRLWDPASGACTAILEGHSAKVFSVCIVPAGREDQNCFVLASASEDRTVRLWDPASGTCEAVLSGHDAGVFGVCAIPLGNRTLLASASEDRTVRLWDPATERVITSIPVHHPAWGCVAVGAGKLALRLSAGVLVLQLNATELLQ